MIVVGAGLAGSEAAWQAAEAGVDVPTVVVEAQNQPMEELPALFDAVFSRLFPALAEAGVRLHVDDRAAALLPAGVEHVPATEEDWDVEYLALELAVAVVDDLDAALAHIRAHSSGHTESILTRDLVSQQRFLAEVDSAVVMHNASTRFTDGGEFGFGAEVGISTQKAHARGPMGLPELTSSKWIVRGTGQVRS